MYLELKKRLHNFGTIVRIEKKGTKTDKKERKLVDWYI